MKWVFRGDGHQSDENNPQRMMLRNGKEEIIFALVKFVNLKNPVKFSGGENRDIVTSLPLTSTSLLRCAL